MVKRRRTGFFGNLATAAGAGMALASRYRNRNGSRTTTMRRRNVVPAPVISEKDTAVRYVYKRMPRVRRRRWTRFLKGVNHVTQASMPIQIYTKKQVGSNVTLGDQQGYGGYLCGAHSLSGNDEIQQCFFDAYATTNLLDVTEKKLSIKSICMDLQFTNMSTSYSLVIDLYLIKLRQNPTSTQSVTNQFTALFAEMDALTVANVTDPALTPFQNSNFCSRFKILKKREILLGPKECSTHQIRRPGNFTIDGRALNDYRAGKPYRTLGYFWMVRGAPDLVGETLQLAPASLAHGVQWTVSYALPPTTKIGEAIRTA